MGHVRYQRVPSSQLADPVRITLRPLERSFVVQIQEHLIDPLLAAGLAQASRSLVDRFAWLARPASVPPIWFRLRTSAEVPDHRLVYVDLETPGRIDVLVPPALIAAEAVPRLEAHAHGAMRFLRSPPTDLQETPMRYFDCALRRT